MTSIYKQWTELDLGRKMTAVLGVLALLAVVGSLARIALQPSLVLLYSGLEAGASGDVVRALEQRGVPYEVRGDAIFVPNEDRDPLRMTLASEGLPANSSQGYELLDSLSGFGTTSQMFDAAYLRAKEGELARTIVASPQITSVRVHIAQPQQSAFSRQVNGTASVFLTATGNGVDASQAKALKYLVASAVAGVSPDSVSIIDTENGLIGLDEQRRPTGNGEELADGLRSKVARLLEARVGAGNAIVEVSVETSMQSESIKERIFDPEGRVAISTDSEERSDSEEGQGGGSVTVASNLPDGNAGTEESSKAQGSETRERINYEVSETQREILKTPGAIKRISVAVLVNAVADTNNPDSAVPRGDAELSQLENLVKSAVGFDAERGDLLSIQSMEFVQTPPTGTGPVEQPLFDMTIDMMTLIQMAILALVGLLIGFFVVRPILLSKDGAALPALSPPEPDAYASDSSYALDGEIEFTPPPPNALAIYDDLSDDQNSNVSDVGQDDSPVARLREMIDTRQEETVDILRQWLEQKERQQS